MLQAPCSAAAAEHERVQGLWVSQLPHVSLKPPGRPASELLSGPFWSQASWKPSTNLLQLLLTGSLCFHQRQRLRDQNYCCRVEAAARANGNPAQASPVICESFWLEGRLVSYGCQLSTALDSRDSRPCIQHIHHQILLPSGMTALQAAWPAATLLKPFLGASCSLLCTC